MKTNHQNQRPEIAETLGVSEGQTATRQNKRLVLVVAALAIAALVLLFGFKRTNGQAPRYKTLQATRGALTVTVTATGNLAPTRKVEVGSELSGIITRVTVDYNDPVEKGQPMAYLDDTKFKAAVMGSRAALASAKAKLQQAQATMLFKQQNLQRLRRAGSLSSGRALSPNDLESAEADLEIAKADDAASQAAIQQAEATLKVDETNLSKTVIYSPVNGVVLLRSVDPGQTVAATLQAPVLFTLAEDLTQMELQVDVDEADVGQVAAGQAATFTVDAYPDRKFEATITQVRYGSQTTSGVVTYTTLLKVENPDLALRPGMTATADIVVQKIADALLVPNAALRFTPPKPTETNTRGGLIGMLLPRPPQREESQAETTNDRNQQRVWILRQGQPVAIPVVAGPTNGSHTVIAHGDLQPDTPLVVDVFGQTP
jgi:HlyD family secretion protein